MRGYRCEDVDDLLEETAKALEQALAAKAEAELARSFFGCRIASDVVMIRQRKSRKAPLLCIGCDFFRRHAAIGDERVDM